MNYQILVILLSLLHEAKNFLFQAAPFNWLETIDIRIAVFVLKKNICRNIL